MSKIVLLTGTSATAQDASVGGGAQSVVELALCTLQVAGIAFKYFQHSRAAQPIAPAVPVAFGNSMQSTAHQVTSCFHTILLYTRNNLWVYVCTGAVLDDSSMSWHPQISARARISKISTAYQGIVCCHYHYSIVCCHCHYGVVFCHCHRGTVCCHCHHGTVCCHCHHGIVWYH